MDVDAVIGNYNGEQFLGDCLGSVACQTRPPRRVLVIDAGSTDGSVELARSLGATVVPAENRGLGYLYNLGVEHAKAPFVFVANNDVALAPDCLERLVDVLASHPDAFSVDPRQDTWRGDGLVHARTTLRRGPLFRQPIPGFRLDLKAPAAGVAETLCTNAGAMLVHRDRYRDLDGFDETFFLDFEDLDLCWRAWFRGWVSLHDPHAVVRHHVGMSHRGRRDVRVRRFAQSHHNLVRWALKCLPAREAAVVVAGELLRLPRHPIVIGRGLASLLDELPEIWRQRRHLGPTRRVFEYLLAL